MKIKHREKLLTIGAVAVIVLLAGDRLFVSPLTRLWKERAERIVALSKTLGGGRLLQERGKSIRGRWSYMESNALPVNVSVAENLVLKSVDRWAQASRISFTSIKPQWKQNEEDHMTFECRTDAFGGMQALTQFLYEMEKDPLAIKIEDVEITAKDNEGQQLSLGVRFSGLLLLTDKK